MSDVVVLGAGVVGLTTAIRLAERGLNVTIISAADPLDTCSVLASAMVGPTFGFAGERATRWEAATVSAFRTSEADAPGVTVRRGRFIARPAGSIPPAATNLPGYTPCADHEMPPGYETAFWAEVPLVDMPVYIADLVERAENLGARIERQHVATVAELTDRTPLIANCSGLGARHLFADLTVSPLRGPKLVVANPGIDTFALVRPEGTEFTNYHPHGDVVVLGGSATESWDTTPDPGEAAAIIARCGAIEPRLLDATLLEHRVGLRPNRPTPRLETERIGSATIVHNYGHGASGVTYSWGCADEVTALLN